jgi:hypothetical protein
MEHEHDPNKPTEMCDEHLRLHGATIVAELLNRELLVIGTPNHTGDGLSLQHVLSMGVGDEKVYIAIDDGHGHDHGDHDGHDHDHGHEGHDHPH